MTRWKKDAREFEVGVNYVKGRGYSSSIPKPIIEILGNPDSLKFVISKGNKIELVAGKRLTSNIKKVSNVNK
jgi:hypothetical protein